MVIVWGAGDFHLICIWLKIVNTPPPLPQHSHTKSFDFNLCVKVETLPFSSYLPPQKEMFSRFMIPVFASRELLFNLWPE